MPTAQWTDTRLLNGLDLPVVIVMVDKYGKLQRDTVCNMRARRRSSASILEQLGTEVDSREAVYCGG